MIGRCDVSTQHGNNTTELRMLGPLGTEERIRKTLRLLGTYAADLSE